MADRSPHEISSPRRAVGCNSRVRASSSIPVVSGIHWSARTSGTAASSARSSAKVANASVAEALATIR